MKQQGKKSMNSFSVKLWVNERRIKKSGQVSLYIQVIVDRKHKEIPLKLEWPFNKIDLSQGILLPREKEDKDHHEFSMIIQTEKNKYWDLAKLFRLQEKDFTLEQLLQEARVYERRRSLVKYFETRIESLKADGEREDQSLRHYRCTMNRIKKFDPEVRLTQVDKKWLVSFAAFLKKKYKNSKNTVWAKLKDVKSFLEAADNEGIAVNRDFRNFTNKKVPGNILYLEEDEIRRLMILHNSGRLYLEAQRDLRAFLFACFTGLRISDLKRVSDSWVHGKELRFTPHKTRGLNKQVTIPLIPLALSFIRENKSANFDLPSEQKMNERLKKIAGWAEINKRLSTKVARHTFGTQSAIAGIPIQVISKIMGHSSIQTTMIYVHVADEIKQREMVKLQVAFEFKNEDGPGVRAAS